MERIDIIVPVYNGYEDVIKCYHSLMKYTDFDECRIIFIDDNSPDARILPLLKSFEAKNNIIVKHNEENLGFSSNVNIGMKMSESNDVILLNSDTIVTKNWVNKIHAAAYSSEEIATVTPLSNAATLCSYPNFCEDNKIPTGMTVDSMAKLVENVSLKKYPRITVAVGFCMFIKRKVIQEIGYFDAKTFGRGYGEENDFCNRAEQMGYIHVMADDTFIYHKGTASFDTEEKRKLIEEHNKILDERYPEQMKNNAQYCAENPDQYIRDNINIYRLLNNGRQTILYLIHADFRDDCPERHGGTQYHVKDLTDGIKYEKNIIVAAREDVYLNVTIYVDDQMETFKFNIDKYDGFQKIHDRKLRTVLKNILVAFHVDLIHVHHVQRLSLDIFELAKELKIRIIMTLHDFYMLCPTCKAVDETGKFCEFSDVDKCDNCLRCKKMIAPTVSWIEKWRKLTFEAMDSCDCLITPSENCKNYFTRVYPELENKIFVISHGIADVEKCSTIQNISNYKAIKETGMHTFIDCCLEQAAGLNRICGWTFIEDKDSSNYQIIIKIDSGENTEYYFAKKEQRTDISQVYENKKYEMSGFELTVPYSKYAGKKLIVSVLMKNGNEIYTNEETYSYNIAQYLPNSKLRIAFIGGVTVEKGTKTIKKLIDSFDSKIVSWYQFGEVGDEELLNLKVDNYIKTGKYDREEISGLLEGYGIDIVCILSCWPETYCYTLSEAFSAHKPVIGVNIGAVGERINKDNGWLVSTENSFDEIRNIINDILKNNEILQEKDRTINTIYLKSTQEMCKEYINLYNKYGLRSFENLFNVDYQFVFNASEYSFVTEKEKSLKSDFEELQNRCNQLEDVIQDINATKSIKFVKKMRKILIGK